jgi:fibronectin type 3 domain-containing protein
MKKTVIFISAILLLLSNSLSAQQSQGLDALPSALNQAMTRAQPHGIVTAENSSPGNGEKNKPLPHKVDLSNYLPPVKSQGSIGSCAAWSTVYYAKTIQENQERGWGVETEDHQFSPLFTYNQITKGVNKGTPIVQHMILMEEQGASTLTSFPHIDNIKIMPDEKVFNNAANYRAESYRKLDRYDREKEQWIVDLKTVKTFLAEGLPVVGGFQIYENFYKYPGGVYNKISGKKSGGHAMCIVGYDDAKGALHIVNSWGTNWGEEGFFWLDYDLFEQLCVYNCAVMYDIIEIKDKKTPPSAPGKLVSSMGAYSDKISLSWNASENTDFYIIYRVDNKEGVLKEIGRSETPAYEDEALKPKLNYIYAVKSARKSSNDTLISKFSEISEGWTAQEKYPPGIPAALTYLFYEKNPLLRWESVETAEGYYIYRWDNNKEDFLKIGSSTDSSFLDKSFSLIREKEIQYYIVQAFNTYGEGYATDCISVVEETIEKEETIIISKIEEDDIIVPEDEKSEFDGEYKRSDYFDYEYTMAQFQEFYKKEMEAFRSFQKEELSAFEEWKRQNNP